MGKGAWSQDILHLGWFLLLKRKGHIGTFLPLCLPHLFLVHTAPIPGPTPQGWAALQTLGKADVAHRLFDHIAGESSAKFLQWEDVGSLILVIRDNALHA